METQETQQIQTKEDNWQNAFKDAVTPVETTETVAETVQTTENVATTTEAPATETTPVTEVKTNLKDVFTTATSPEAVQEQELEKRFLEKNKDKFEKLSKIEKIEALSFLVDNWEKIDHSKAFANQTKSYDHITDLFELKTLVAKEKGVELTPEELQSSKELFESKLDGMDEIDKKQLRAELLAQLPKGEDNSTYLEKERARIQAEKEQATQKELEERNYWAQKEQFALSIKDKIIGVELPDTGITIDKEMVDTVYETLQKGWATSPRFFDEKNDYHPEWEIEALLYEQAGRNALKIREAAAKEAKIKTIEERTNASQDTNVTAATQGTQLTPEQIEKRRNIFFAYSKNPEMLQAELKKEGLI